MKKGVRGYIKISEEMVKWTQDLLAHTDM